MERAAFSGWATNRGLSPKTIKDYWGYIHRFLGSGLTYQDFWNSMIPSARTKNQARVALIKWFEFSEFTPNGAKGLPRLKETRPVPIPLSDPAGLIEAGKRYSPLFGALICFLLYTGLRIGEALGLEWDNIHGAWAYVIQKGGRQRAVYLNGEVLQAFRELPKSSRWVFVSPVRDAPLSYHWAYRKIRELGLRTGQIGCRTHRCRYTFADKIYQESKDPLLLKEALGHESLQSTMHYVRARPEQVRATIKGLRY